MGHGDLRPHSAIRWSLSKAQRQSASCASASVNREWREWRTFFGGELAKPTPDPTATNGNPAATGRRADAPRAATSAVSRIRALAGQARVGDAELFNILIIAAGRDPAEDEQRAVRQLDRELASLVISLVRKAIDALTQRVTTPASTAERQERGWHDTTQRQDHSRWTCPGRRSAASSSASSTITMTRWSRSPAPDQERPRTLTATARGVGPRQILALTSPSERPRNSEFG